MEAVLPGKMAYNLREMREFSFVKELGTMVETVVAVVK